MKPKLSDIYWPLRLSYGLVPLLAGFDKYLGILADWKRYMSPLAASVLPVPVETFLHIVGVVEVIVGLAVLFGLTRLGALTAMAWLVAIALVAAERGEEFVPNLSGIGAERLAHR